MSTRRFLVVDDHDATRKTLSRLLSVEGFEVTTAASIAEAMTHLNPPPNCIVLDLMLPDGPGETVLQRVRSHNLPTRVTVCTGSNDTNRLAAVRRLNPDALLLKPINIDDLITSCLGEAENSSRTDMNHRAIPEIRTNRCFLRLPYFAKVTLVLRSENSVMEAHSIDISLGETSLACPTPLPIGQLLSITFHLKTGGSAIEERPVSGRVTSVRFENDAAIMGVEFTPILNHEAAPALVRAIERL